MSYALAAEGRNLLVALRELALAAPADIIGGVRALINEANSGLPIDPARGQMIALDEAGRA